MSNPSENSEEDRVPSLGRRAFVAGAGGLLGLAATRGLASWSAPRFAAESSPNAILRELVSTLNPFQREQILFPIDHPSRQVANTISFIDRPQVGVLLSGPQMKLVEQLITTMLSERGLRDMAGTFAVEGDPRAAVLSVYGDPEREDAQALLAGGHFTLRAGAQGGARAYGQQLGNGKDRVQGNAFAEHSELANAFLATLSATERQRAILPEGPNEYELQPEAEGSRIPGVAIASLGERSTEAFEELLGQVLGTYAQGSFGAVDAERLYFSAFASHAYYEGKQRALELSANERRERGLPFYPLWRIEGPGVVIHFHGDPHVHAYVQVSDPDVPGSSNVGESIARISRGLDVPAMRTLHEAALRRASGEALVFQRSTEIGRLCAGEITTGLVWTTEPFRSRVVVAEIRGNAMAEPLRARLAEAGVRVEDARSYRIATTDSTAGMHWEFGKPEKLEPSETELRETLIAMIREGALEPA